MKNMSDIIESYLKEVLSLQGINYVDVRRNELAEQFQCVPSQVNYVINTRFTLDKGFMIESKRGGGGYIRIVKVRAHDRSELFDQIISLIGCRITQIRAEDLILRMYEEKIITEREMKLIMSIAHREVLAFSDYAVRDELRAKLLHAIIRTLRYTPE